MVSSIVRVLVLGAEPKDGPSIHLMEELRRIKRERGVQVVPIWHTNFSDIIEQIEAVRPHIVQFSGHGASDGQLVLEDRDGQHELVPTQAIELLCEREVARRYVRGVLLNACYTLPLAEKLTRFFDFAVGTAQLIANPAAVRFPAPFYEALASGEHIQDACRAGEAAFALKQLENRPLLVCAKGIDPKGYRLRVSAPEKPILYIHHYPGERSGREVLRELRTQLQPLEDIMEIWDRSQIAGGETRTESITRNVERASLFLFLVSAEALANDEWVKIKDRACMRQQARTARGFPLLLRACLFMPEDFNGVDAINLKDRLIAGLPEAQRAKSWLDAAKRLKSEAIQMQKLFAEERVKEQEINQRLAAISATAATDARTETLPPPQPPAGSSPTTALIPGKVPTRASVRKILFAAFPDVQDLITFCTDYFDKETRTHLSAKPNKLEVATILFDYVGTLRVMICLITEEPARIAPHMSLLRYD